MMCASCSNFRVMSGTTVLGCRGAMMNLNKLRRVWGGS
jgi:hypothetical protein